MSPADRAALAARLRHSVQVAADFGDSVVHVPSRDLLAAAAELERPRPRVEWTAPTGDTVEAHLRGVGMIWRGWLSEAEAHAERWRAAGLDVGEVPRG